ncbi:MAG: glycerol-3-phosphate 1-O-acyltransferase PlsY [Gemmatimonadaceae bacterium]
MALAALVLAYLVGSLPIAYAVGKLKGIDLRRVGSGNLGATNVYRTLGTLPAAAVLVLDAAKGALPAAFFVRWFDAPHPAWGLLYGLAAVAGHVWPAFLGFKGGGKGVATTAGVFAALAPIAFLSALAAFVVTVAATRYVSLGSLLAAGVLPVAVAATQGVASPLFSASCAIVLFVFWTHRSNIARLRRGDERRLGRPGHA